MEKDTKFKKGWEGGPGRPALSPEVVELKNLNQFEFHKILNDLSFKTKDELQAKINNPNTPILELAVASILAKSITSGDQNRLSYVTDRLVGKPKETIEMTVRPHGELTDDELDRRIEAAQRRKALTTREIES